MPEVVSLESKSKLTSTLVWVKAVEMVDPEVETAALALSERVDSSLLLPVTMAELLDLK